MATPSASALLLGPNGRGRRRTRVAVRADEIRNTVHRLLETLGGDNEEEENSGTGPSSADAVARTIARTREAYARLVEEVERRTDGRRAGPPTTTTFEPRRTIKRPREASVSSAVSVPGSKTRAVLERLRRAGPHVLDYTIADEGDVVELVITWEGRLRAALHLSPISGRPRYARAFGPGEAVSDAPSNYSVFRAIERRLSRELARLEDMQMESGGSGDRHDVVAAELIEFIGTFVDAFTRQPSGLDGEWIRLGPVASDVDAGRVQAMPFWVSLRE